MITDTHIGQGPHNTQTPRSADQKNKEAAQYIADMILELRNIARSEDLKDLQGVLELAYYEAFAAANRVEIPENEMERLKEMARSASASERS
jgi:CRISPR/Cas system-associated endonuclease Cas1